jgi:AraC family transcriptional regulator
VEREPVDRLISPIPGSRPGNAHIEPHLEYTRFTMHRELPALRRYAPGLAIGRHEHAHAVFCLVLSGHYQDTVRKAASVHGRGHMLYCPAFEPHAQEIGEEGALKVLISVNSADLEALQAGHDLDAPLHAVDERYGILAGRIAAELRSQDRFGALAVEGLKLEALSCFLRARVTGDVPTWIRHVRDYLETPSADPVSLTALAKVAGRDKREIGRAFVMAYGVTPTAFMRRRRLEQAGTLIVRGDGALAEIASACGFSDQSHMTRCFRAAFGMTPTEFRKSARSQVQIGPGVQAGRPDVVPSV